MHSDPRFKAANDAFSGLDTPRVWSLLVTIFGDLAQEPDDRIAGPLLTQLTDAMGIKPEAVRVALHRLRNDDWIQSIKSGRTAQHTLSPHGRELTQSASQIIYARPSDMTDGWQVAVTETNTAEVRSTMRAAQFAQLAPRLFFASQSANAPKDTMVLTNGTVPKWLQSQITDTELTRQFSDLVTALERLNLQLRPAKDLSTLEIAVFRSLIVHHWRRLVLRTPYLPPALTGADWPGHVCRNRVTALLTQLPRPSLMDLQAE